MTTKETITYIAYDGKEFNDMQKCIDYEENFSIIPRLKEYGFMLFDENGVEIEIEPDNRLREYELAEYMIIKKQLPDDIYNHFHYVVGYYIPTEPGVYKYEDFDWSLVEDHYNILTKLIAEFKNKGDTPD